MSHDVPVEGQEAASTFAHWGALDWRERRQRRFERWLDPTGVDFISDQIRNAYEERVHLVIDALELRRPERVPVFPQMGLYTARYSGLNVREAMYDKEKLAAAWARFHADFRPDFQADDIIPGRVFELAGGKFLRWPGHGVNDDTPWQYVEAEYMKPDEYDALISDPSAYFMRVLLPRIAQVFEPLAALNPFADMIEAATLPYSLIPFGNPGVLSSLAQLAEAARAAEEHAEAMSRSMVEVVSRLGIPAFWAGLVKAPYDILADTLRGTRGIAMDHYRQPAKILAAAERFAPLQIDAAVRQMAKADSPLICIPLHKGADDFMSVDDYEKFYWPTLKAVILGLVTEGIVPVLFAEGSYNRRLSVIADPEIPSGSVIWWFDKTDMVEAKRALRGRACVCGNVPAVLLAIGQAPEVEEYVVGLLDAVAGEGGFILGSGTVVDDAKPETLGAMIEAGRSWTR